MALIEIEAKLTGTSEAQAQSGVRMDLQASLVGRSGSMGTRPPVQPPPTDQKSEGRG